MSMNESTALDVLAKATSGLLFLSETDAPLVPFFWPNEDTAPLAPARLLELANAKPDSPIKTVTLAHFFRNATKEEAWHNEEEQAEVERFKALVATLKSTLKKPQVFRVGEVSIDVYIVGLVEGGYAGLQTRVVET
ncbi:MAG: nuclease [Proteobacteria bacterium]|nr:MAG: nuclease [Pseudomonadota bacterium]